MFRSMKDLEQYRIDALDGDVGHVEDCYFDDDSWAIRNLFVETGNWWIGQEVLVAPEWSTEIDRVQETVTVHLTRQSIADAPSNDGSSATTRQHDALLDERYGQTGYRQDSDLAESHTE